MELSSGQGVGMMLDRMSRKALKASQRALYLNLLIGKVVLMAAELDTTFDLRGLENGSHLWVKVDQKDRRGLCP